MKNLIEDLSVLSIGGATYSLIEILWRGYSHWTMILTGGVCFLSLYKTFNKFSNLNAPQKCIIGSLIISSIEFIVGCIVNVKFKLNVWDYSNVKFNILGQVCIIYSVLWGILCLPIDKISRRLHTFFKKINNNKENAWKIF